MGTIFSLPDDPNPSNTTSQTPSENPDQENTSKTLNPNQDSQNPNQESSKPVQDNADPDKDLEEEEEGECPFCAYMKGGACRETFINWEKCVEEGGGGEDIVEKCTQVTMALTKCMEANQDYYAPILHAEKMVEQQALNQLEQENAAKEEKTS